MKFSFLLLVALVTHSVVGQKQDFAIIAYYSAGPEQVENLPAEKLTHIIFSFCHLAGNKITVNNSRDSLTIQKLNALKKRNPKLKVILSLGGWGGCETCSDVFSTDAGRKQFSESLLKLNAYFHSDGIDLDWEYPTIEGYPGHPYKLQDKDNFTALFRQLRKTMGPTFELSFASGGFQKFMEQSVDWKEVMKIVDRVNVMSYDLINGYAVETGHHTALYSNPLQKESTDNAAQYMIQAGVPRNKIVVGAAFYARVWENVSAEKNGLYQAGKFKMAIDFKDFTSGLKDYQLYWDDTSKAPYAYNASEKLFATFDDARSIKLKTQYVIDQKLNGIMFWELSLDSQENSLVDCMYDIKTGKTR